MDDTLAHKLYSATLLRRHSLSLKSTKLNIDQSSTVSFRQLNVSNSILPTLIFIPGLDGNSDYARSTFENLTGYDVWRMSVTSDDRSSFTFLASTVSNFISRFPKPVTLMGESFGGLLAVYIALRSKSYVSRLILVNPATSFDQTIWPTLGTLISYTGPGFAALGTLTLVATVVEPYQISKQGEEVIARITSTEDAVREVSTLLSVPKLIAELLPPATLRWRLRQWLEQGTDLMKGKYSQILTPTLILVGSRDRLLPSAKEGYRLIDEMINATTELKVFRIGGHAILDGYHNITDVILSSKIFNTSAITSSTKQPILNYFPSEADLKEINQGIVQTLYNSVSPIFLSRNKDGKLIRGLEPTPVGGSGRPVLFVGNHQLYGADLSLIIKEFLTEKRTLVRGLAHPALFQTDPERSFGQNISEITALLTRFGAVEASPASLCELMQMNATALLFPGGGREAYHRRGEDYELFWPEKVDFLRLAAIFNATIVPFAAVGVADSFAMLLDGDDILKLPVIGAQAQRYNRRLPRVRANIEENFATPLSLPKLPQRNYFLFQKVLKIILVLVES